MPKVTISFTLDSTEDRDILRWLEAQENRSAAIREALRASLGRGGVTLADVYQAVKDLERRLWSGSVVPAGPTGQGPSGRGQADPPDEPEEPPDLVTALDALARL